MVVGFCVRLAAGEDFEGFVPGATAALIAILSVVGGKYAAVSMAVRNVDLGQFVMEMSEEEMIVGMADEIIREQEAKGKKVQFPAGKTIETAEKQADYPPAIWNQASQKWKGLGPEGQATRRAEQKAQMAEFVGAFQGQMQQAAFAESFSGYDALWFILAALSAYRIGHGNVASDDD